MILVTGASGFLGQHLMRELSARGEKVRALYHNNPPTTQLSSLPGTEWCKADLLDIFDVEEIMRGVTHVYHCAALVSFQKDMEERMLHFNPESTTNIVNQAVEQGITKMVYVSSIAALGRPGDGKKEISEEEQWGESKYNSAYALSKYMAETEVWRGIGEGLNAVIVNPGIILGEGDWEGGGSPGLIKIAWNEFPFYTRGVNAWVDVLDVARVLPILMDGDNEAERYIVSEGNHSYQEIFTLMANSLEKKPPRIYANSLITGLVWRFGQIQKLFGKNPAITKETANTAHALSIYNNAKLLQLLPDFQYSPIAQTIERMATRFILDRNDIK